MTEKWALAIKRHEGWITPGGAYPNGSRSYRNNNPGNLRYTSYTAALGKNKGHDDKNFVIYVSYEAGLAALKQFLIDASTDVLRPYRVKASELKKDSAGKLTLYEFYSVYAPSTDGNYPRGYAEAVAKDLGVSPETRIKDLLDEVEPTLPAPSDPEPVKPQSVISQRQGDPAWGSIRIGESNTTVARDGCLITGISDYLFWLGFKITPGQLARLLKFTPGGSLYWESLANVPLKFVYRYRFFDKGIADAALSHPTKGLMLEVPLAGASHWLWAIGKDWLGRYKIADPLKGDFALNTRYGAIKGMAIIDKK